GAGTVRDADRAGRGHRTGGACGRCVRRFRSQSAQLGAVDRATRVRAMSAATILLYGVAGVPMALALLALWPSARERLIHALPFAALPALAASLVVEVGSATPLPRVLLGAPLMLDAPGRLFLGIGALVW